MTPQEIRDAVAASAELQALQKDGRVNAIADALSVGRVKFVPIEIGNGTILEKLGITTGNALLDVINTSPDFRYVKPLVEQGRLRLDSPLVRGTLASLVVAGVVTQAQADVLLSAAQSPDPVTTAEVESALGA